MRKRCSILIWTHAARVRQQGFVGEDKRESKKEWLLHMFRFFAKCQKQNKEFQIWQKTSHPIEVYSNAVIDQKVEYIQMNPVVSGITTIPDSYVFSSANPDGLIGIIEA